MNVAFDWTILEKVGVAGICLALIYFGFQAFKLILLQWQSSTEAVNKNMQAFQNLSRVFERSHEREIIFQEEMIERMKDTQEKVLEIHKKVV